MTIMMFLSTGTPDKMKSIYPFSFLRFIVCISRWIKMSYESLIFTSGFSIRTSCNPAIRIHSLSIRYVFACYTLTKSRRKNHPSEFLIPWSKNEKVDRSRSRLWLRSHLNKNVWSFNNWLSNFLSHGMRRRYWLSVNLFTYGVTFCRWRY